MLEIRDTGPDDLAAIAEIFNALLDTTTFEWSERRHTAEERAEWFTAHRAAGFPAIVAVLEGDVVGAASYGHFRDSVKWPGYRFTVEHSIHVREDCWGRRIGRTLLEALIDRARGNGLWVMVGAIDGSNERSIRFHERLGFTEVARMPGIGEKFGRRLDLVLMQRDLM